MKHWEKKGYIRNSETNMRRARGVAAAAAGIAPVTNIWLAGS